MFAIAGARLAGALAESCRTDHVVGAVRRRPAPRVEVEGSHRCRDGGTDGDGAATERAATACASATASVRVIRAPWSQASAKRTSPSRSRMAARQRS